MCHVNIQPCINEVVNQILSNKAQHVNINSSIKCTDNLGRLQLEYSGNMGRLVSRVGQKTRKLSKLSGTDIPYQYTNVVILAYQTFF